MTGTILRNAESSENWESRDFVESKNVETPRNLGTYRKARYLTIKECQRSLKEKTASGMGNFRIDKYNQRPTKC